MVFPILQFLEEIQLYDAKDLATAKLDLINKTKMVDEAMDQYKALYGKEPPKEMVELRSETRGALKSSAKKLKVLLDAIAKEMEKPSDNFTMARLRTEGVTDENLEDLYAHSKLNFDCGAYQKAADYLHHYRELSSNEDKNFMALWGKLGGEILAVHDNEVNEERAVADIKELHNLITQRGDAGKLDHLEQMQQRTWLIHWGLFLFSQLPPEDGQILLLDFLFQDKIMNAVQTTSPHMLRYLTVAAIIGRRKKTHPKDNGDNKDKLDRLVTVLVQERESYNDSVTEFLYNLYHEFDFEAAQNKLQECAVVTSSDFFLGAGVRELFLEEARMLMFETYCRIHRRIDVSELGRRLGLEQDENLTPTIMRYIKEAQVDAKIDSNQNQIVMGTAPLSIYQQVIEGTKNLHYKSNEIFARISERLPRD
jgi:translation initiation factor 3 subunit E